MDIFIALSIYGTLLAAAIIALALFIYIVKHRRKGDILYIAFWIFTIAVPSVAVIWSDMTTMMNTLCMLYVVLSIWYIIAIIYVCRERGMTNRKSLRLGIILSIVAILIPIAAINIERYELGPEIIKPVVQVRQTSYKETEVNGEKGVMLSYQLRFLHLSDCNGRVVIKFLREDKDNGGFFCIQGTDPNFTLEDGNAGVGIGNWVIPNNYYDLEPSVFVPYKSLPHTKGTNAYCTSLEISYVHYPHEDSENYRDVYVDELDRTFKYFEADFNRSNMRNKYSRKNSTSRTIATASTPKQQTAVATTSSSAKSTNTTETSSVSSSYSAPQTPQYESLPPITYTARTWSESSSFAGVQSHTTYTQSSDGWITREYHQQCTMCHGSGKCQICYCAGGKWYGMSYMPCAGCGGSGRCRLCNGSGEYMSSTTRYLPFDEYYQAETGDVVHLLGKGQIGIYGVAGNMLLYSKDFEVEQYGGYYHFGGNIGSPYLSYLPYPKCKLSTDRNTLYIDEVKYTRCSKSKYTNARKFYEQTCAQIGVQPYYFSMPDISTSNSTSTSSSTSSSSSSSMSRYGYKSCHICHGSGECQSCNRHGVATSGYTGNPYVCGVCGGTHRCRFCQGTGKVYGLK